MGIRTREEHPSMNLGQAVAVCLYEMVRELKVPAKPEKEAAATAAELDRLTATVFEALRARAAT